MPLGVALEELLSNAELEVDVMFSGKGAHENENIRELISEAVRGEGFVVRRPRLLHFASNLSDLLDQQRYQPH